MIDVGIGRRRFGDYPDATLVQLANLYPADGPYYDKAVAALKEQAPDTDEAARAIVDKIDHERRAAAMDAIAESRRESRGHSLDGPPPILPPPAMQGEPQRLSNGSDWAEAKELASAVACLRRLQSKPIARLVGRVAPDELRKVAGFLNEIADKQTEKCEP